MENTRYDSDVVEIDLGEIFALLLHKAWIIILCAVLLGAAGFGVSKFMLTEMYESTTDVYILNKSDNSEIAYSDVQLSSQLTKDYAQLITSRKVLEAIIAEYKPNMTYGEFADRISVSIPTDTRIISITVTDEDPAMAQLLADEVRKEASAHIKNVMDIQAVNVVDVANLPEGPASPSIPKWTLVGAMVGAFLAGAIILVRFMLDDTIKTSDDVERYLGLSTLGMIPIREDADKLKSQQRRGRRSRRVEPVEMDDVEDDEEEKEETREVSDDTLTMVDVEAINQELQKEKSKKGGK